VLTSIIVGGTLAYQYQWLPKNNSDNGEEASKQSSEYKTVTIQELITNIDEYNEKNVYIRGKFTGLNVKPIPQCIPIGTGENPEIRENYMAYPATWGVFNQDGEISVVVIGENDVRIGTLPNYVKDRDIALKGTIKSTTISDYCNRDIRNKSLYIELSPKDIDITLKPLPDSIPR
jgi:hypothetical protein